MDGTFCLHITAPFIADGCEVAIGADVALCHFSTPKNISQRLERPYNGPATP
jgi:hypothetical protein